MSTPRAHLVPGSGGVTLHVLDHPPAPETSPGAPFLLVHGLASCARLWDGVGAALARRGHRAVAVDQRGHGGSDKPDDGYDFATLCRDLASVIAGAGLERPVVVGQSWGGNVVLELGARAPDLVRGVAAVDGGTITLADRFPDWEECAEALAPPRLDGIPAERFERMLRAAHPDWPETGIAGALGTMQVREDGTIAPWLSRARHMRILRHLWEHRPGERYAELRCGVLLIPAVGGPHEWARDKEGAIARAQERLARVRVHWMEGDHDLHAQHPERIAALLVEGLEDGLW